MDHKQIQQALELVISQQRDIYAAIVLSNILAGVGRLFELSIILALILMRRRLHQVIQLATHQPTQP